MLDLLRLRILLVGGGPRALRRLNMLDEAGAQHVEVFAKLPSAQLMQVAGNRLQHRLPEQEDVARAAVMFVADVPIEAAQHLYSLAHGLGVPANVEDVTELCDFHVPAIVRRGDLVIAVGTGGKTPGLARRIKKYLGELFGAEWGGRVEELSRHRQSLYAQGKRAAEVARECDMWVDEKQWLSSCEAQKEEEPA